MRIRGICSVLVLVLTACVFITSNELLNIFTPWIHFMEQENITHGKFVNSSHLKTNVMKIAWYKNLHWLPHSFDFSRCNFKNCELSENIQNITSYDAVIFHYRLLGSEVPTKAKGQIWILWNTESPANDKPLPTKWRRMFDWTATYRLDSEIINQRVLKFRQSPLEKNYSDIFHKKKKFAAWVVSNCQTPSKRRLYVKELRKFMQVDVFGKCGSNKTVCQNKSMAECHLLFSKDYKFYFGLENSLCRDYITEKLYHGFLEDNNMIYVYRGAPNVDNVIPQNTFVNTDHFSRPKVLAEYLKKIGGNELEYISFLKEKNKYLLLENKVERVFCSLCDLLNTYEHKSSSWTGHKFNNWFRNGACRTMTAPT